MIKGLNDQEDVIIINIYVPNIREPKSIQLISTELKGEIDSNIVTKDFNTLISIMDRNPQRRSIRKQST